MLQKKAFPDTIKLLDLGKRCNVHLHKDKLRTFSEKKKVILACMSVSLRRFIRSSYMLISVNQENPGVLGRKLW